MRSPTMVLCAALGACTAETPIVARSPVPHPIGPVVHVVTDTPNGDVETVSVLGLEEAMALRERVSNSAGSSGVDRDRSTQLVREAVSTPRFVCLAPCDQTLLAKPDQELMVSDDGQLASAPFRLDPNQHQVTLQVRRSNVPMRHGAQALLGIGAATAVVGLVLPARGLVTAGGAVIAAGATSIGVGTALYFTSRTSVTIVPGGIAF